MSTFAMNVVAPDSPVPFTTLGGEVIYWLNPNGTVTIDGTWESILLPNGVVDTGMRGGLNEAGDIILYRSDVDGYYNTNLTELNPNTGLPYASGETRSEMGPMDFVRASVDGYLTALEQFAAKANASLPDASKINIDVFKRLTLLTKTGPLAVIDAMVNYQSDGASGVAKVALGTAAGFLAGAIVTGTSAGAPALLIGAVVIGIGVSAAYATNLVWDAMNGHERFDQLTTWLDTQMVDGGDQALEELYGDAAELFGDQWDLVNDKFTNLMKSISARVDSVGSFHPAELNNMLNLLIPSLMVYSDSFTKIFEYLAIDNSNQEKIEQQLEAIELEGLLDASSVFSREIDPVEKEALINYSGIRYSRDRTQAIFYDGNVFEDGLEFRNPNYRFEGGKGDDVLYGSDANISRIWGNDGNDFITLRAADSTAYGGADDDYITVDGVGQYKIIGGTGHDTVITGASQDFVFLDSEDGTNSEGMDGDDYASTGADTDWVDGGDGKDIINAGEGDNHVFGGRGQDTIIVGDGNNQIYSDGYSTRFGNTVVEGSVATTTWELNGYIHADTALDKSQYNDLIMTGNGNNRIVAGAGDDTIITGNGSDYIHGDVRPSSGYTFVGTTA